MKRALVYSTSLIRCKSIEIRPRLTHVSGSATERNMAIWCEAGRATVPPSRHTHRRERHSRTAPALARTVGTAQHSTAQHSTAQHSTARST